MKYFIKTFGCQMNTSDSERIATFLEQQNFSLAEKIEDAGLAIFNTCGIKQTAENRAYSMINNLRKANKETKIIMTGCLANRKDVQMRMKKSVDLFCEIKNFQKDFSTLIQDTRYKIQDTKNYLGQENISYLSINPKHANNFTAYVPIMTGCNNFCSYCVVPYARGREVSRPADEVINEIRELVKKGFKNIVLLGQNVNSYTSQVHRVHQVHQENSNTVNFPQLLKKINSIPGKFWISYVSSHPKDMSEELIETTAKCKKVCEWIHLPLQAGNDEVLRRMNRKYTHDHYLKLIKKIRAEFKKHKPDSLYSISSDIIVGFPGETKVQFADSEMMMKKCKFDMVFFGQYSPRPGTVAWEMKDNVSQKEKVRRENALNEILKKTTFANNKKYANKIIEVLVDHVKSDLKSDHVAQKSFVYFGKTRTQKNVKFESKKKYLIGKIIKVKITKANIWNLEGNVQ